ncbi:Chitinase [Pseudomonas chlororaphis]|uniref:chitinase n=1 Tax=Pseudomonas chlororaphis TaxID=587753 RepID=A0A3G7TTF4_9PSED|nr:glycosyl hydrolase family 18 protein [Pseudomonas chlororaphis]AZE50397.1 Chitinase [Pseudomonas chlororaphis]
MYDEKKYQYTSKKAMSDASEGVGNSLAAWNNQSGGETFYVIFDSGVYTNSYWVERWHVPDRNLESPSHENAWTYVRPATPQEMAEHGNPTEGIVEPSPDKTQILQPDDLTEKTYVDVNYFPDGSGSNLSYTAARVCKSMYNEYEQDRTRDRPHLKVSAYVTDWCQYDARLPPESRALQPAEDVKPGRGFDLENIPPTAYDRLVFSFLAIYGDKGKLGKEIEAVADGWNSQVEADEAITHGHIVPVDPYGDLGTTRNVAVPPDDRREVGPHNFLQYYNQEAASGLLGGLRNLQERAKKVGHKLELAFSIGGWSMSGYFSPMVKDPQQRRAFVESVVDFFRRFPMFTAVDIDWEYPGTSGEEGNEWDEEHDGPNYAILVGELRKALDGAFGTRARKEITIASSAVVGKLKKSNIRGLIENGLDNIFVMTYDFFGTGWADWIGHHTNLYAPPYAENNPDRLYDLSADEAIQYLINDEGVPPGKIHLGFANYGRSCIGANLSDRTYTKPGMALGTMENGAPEFFCLLNNQFDCEHQLALGKNGFKLMTDTAADADILFNPVGNHYISLDTPRTVMQKGIYADKEKLGGIFSWSGDQDDGLLANAAREGTGYIPKKGREVIDMGPLYNRGELFELPATDQGKIKTAARKRKISKD